MPEKSISESNELERAKALSRIRDRSRIFIEVLGTPRGQLIVDFLREQFKTSSGYPPNMLDSEGRTDPLQTWRKLGHFDVLAFISQQLEYKDVNPSSSGT